MKKYFFFSFFVALVLVLSSFNQAVAPVALPTIPSIVFAAFKESPTFQGLVLREAQGKATVVCNDNLQSYLAEITTPGTNTNAYKRYVYANSVRQSRVGDAVSTRIVSTILNENYFENAFTSGAVDENITAAIRNALNLQFENLAEVEQ